MGYIFLGIASANLIGTQWRGDADVRARNFDRAALRARRTKSGDAPARSSSTISAGSAKSCRSPAWPLASRLSPRSACPAFANFAARSDGFLRRVSTSARTGRAFTFSRSPPSSRSGAWSSRRFTCCAPTGRFSWARLTERFGAGAPPDLARSFASADHPAHCRDADRRFLSQHSFCVCCGRPFASPIAATTDDPRACSRNCRARSGDWCSCSRRHSPAKSTGAALRSRQSSGLSPCSSPVSFSRPPPAAAADRFLEFLRR